jgi:maltose O-acetyltransferase
MANWFTFYFARFLLLAAPEGSLPSLNRFALRLMGARIGSKAVIYSSIKVSRQLKLSVGVETFVGSGAVFVGGAGSAVVIGSHCDISDNVRFVTGTHQIDSIGKRTAGKGYSKNIVVKNGAWIGHSALILPGVTIGEKALIAAGTVVYKDVPARALVAGSPMKQIRTI